MFENFGSLCAPLRTELGRLLEIALGCAVRNPLEADLSESAEQLLNLADTARAAWLEARGAGREAREYLGSAKLESGLDRLAGRMGVSFDRLDESARSSFQNGRIGRIRHRRERIRLKAATLAESSAARLVAAAGIGCAIGAISRKPRIIAGVGFLCAGVQCASMAWDAVESSVEAAAARRP